MKHILSGLIGFAIGAVAMGISYVGSISRQADRIRFEEYHKAKTDIIAEAVHAGVAFHCRPDEDPRGYKWIVRKHSSQRYEYPNDFFIVTNDE